jgi:hypothetical protein
VPLDQPHLLELLQDRRQNVGAVPASELATYIVEKDKPLLTLTR